MTLKNLFSVAAMGLMMVSCSSDEPAADNGGNVPSGPGYLSVKINLPSTTGSRAVTYEEGLANEYSVNDATMYVWKKAGTTEDDYTFVTSADLGKPVPEHPTPDEDVYSDFTVLAELDQLLKASDGEYYALVLLNIKTGDFTVSAPAVGTTYGAWNSAKDVTVSVNFKPQFFMTNSAIYNTADPRPNTLVKIDVSKIQPTKEAAQAAGNGVEVYVERGVAKVTVKQPDTKYDVTGIAYDGDAVEIKSWTLDVTNKKTFTVHKTKGLKDIFSNIWQTPRFIGAHRVYWGIDPNYSDCAPETEDDIAIHFNRAAEENYKTVFDEANPQYCLENTFDIDHMLQGQTTRIVFKAQYTPQGITKGQDFYMVKGEIYSLGDLRTYIKARAMQAHTLADTEITVAIPEGIEAGIVELTQDFFHVTKAGVNVDDAFVGKVEDLIPGDILCYKGGINYYAARIKHFGDAETPWTFGEPTYDKNNGKYLGRYGVLRNNWYELSVTSVSSPGYPVLPPIDPDSPDDENKYYLQTQCHILKWAKRTQEIEL